MPLLAYPLWYPIPPTWRPSESGCPGTDSSCPALPTAVTVVGLLDASLSSVARDAGRQWRAAQPGGNDLCSPFNGCPAPTREHAIDPRQPPALKLMPGVPFSHVCALWQGWVGALGALAYLQAEGGLVRAMCSWRQMGAPTWGAWKQFVGLVMCGFVSDYGEGEGEGEGGRRGCQKKMLVKG